MVTNFFHLMLMVHLSLICPPLRVNEAVIPDLLETAAAALSNTSLAVWPYDATAISSAKKVIFNLSIMIINSRDCFRL